jgi:hypothetical protein
LLKFKCAISKKFTKFKVRFEFTKLKVKLYINKYGFRKIIMNSEKHEMNSTINVDEFGSSSNVDVVAPDVATASDVVATSDVVAAPEVADSSTTTTTVVKKEAKKRKRSAKSAGTTIKTEKPAKVKKVKVEKKAKIEKIEKKPKTAKTGESKTTKKKTEKKKVATKKKTTKKKKLPTKKKTKKPKKKIIKKKLPAKRTIVKSARSVWISFLSKVRAEKRPEHENLSFGELCKLLSPIWKNMSVEDKAPFTETYEMDKARYRAQILNLTDEEKKILRAHKRIRRKRKAGKPKSAVSAYMLSVTALRPDVVANNPTISFQEIGRELGRRWRAMTEDDRAVYTADAKIDRKRYDDEMIAWKNGEEEKRLVRKNEREAKIEERKNKIAAKLLVASTTTEIAV